MGSAVSPEDILRDLAALWTATGAEDGSEPGGVLRACAMTLVVLADEDENLPALEETIAELMPQHPARAILVRIRESAEPSLDARVSAQCWLPFGQRRQICSERIDVTAAGASLGDVHSLLLPLAAPDLPVIVWLRSTRLFDAPEFRDLAALADKLVVDTRSLPDVGAALTRLGAMAEHEPPTGDLAWTQLTRCREMLARAFENRDALARLPEISAVRVAVAGDRPTAPAWYMGAWAVNTLSDAGTRAALELSADPRLGRELVLEMTGGGFRVLLEVDEQHVRIRIGSTSQCASLPFPTDCVLMREELGILRRDPVFERTLAAAARLAAGAPE